MNGLDIGTIERAMVFGAHPDDEIIGPGGTLHRLAALGKETCVVTFTCGGTAANSPEEVEAMIALRKEEMTAADKLLGVTHREVLGIPSQGVYGAVYTDNALHRTLLGILRKYRPQVLFSHARDNHRDHNAINTITNESVFQATEHIALDLGEPWTVPTVLYYGAELEPPTVNAVIEISAADLAAKQEALRTQISQTREGFLERLEQIMRARAELWGAKAYGAGHFAEGFHLDPVLPIRM